MKLILAVFLIVIIDPYKGIKPGNIDIYDYTQKPEIEVIEPVEAEEKQEKACYLDQNLEIVCIYI